MLVTLEEDENGDLILPIPDDIMKAMGVKIGGKIHFATLDDGTAPIGLKFSSTI